MKKAKKIITVLFYAAVVSTFIFSCAHIYYVHEKSEQMTSEYEQMKEDLDKVETERAEIVREYHRLS